MSCVLVGGWFSWIISMHVAGGGGVVEKTKAQRRGIDCRPTEI